MRWDWVPANLDMIGQLALAHAVLTVLPTVAGLLVAVPLGVVAAQVPRSRQLLVGGTSLLYTVPSLALFVLLPSMLGTKILDPTNVVVALTVYTVALLVRVVCDGLLSVPRETLLAAEGTGMGPLARLVGVSLPVALPTLISGLRVVVVSNVSIVTVAATIGVSQLGSLFTLGFTRRSFVPIVVGLVACLLMALLLDLLLVAAMRCLTPWTRV